MVACVITAGCGNAGHAHVPSSTAAAALSPVALSGVRGRVLQAGELRGFTSAGRRLLGMNAASWVVAEKVAPAEAASVTARLRRLGFVAGVREDLIGSDSLAGLSTVEEFRSGAGAGSELASLVHGLAEPGVARFLVPGVPHARGFWAAGDGVNVTFADGAYCYLVGAQVTPGAGPTRAAVIAAVQRLYHRVQR